MPNKNSFAFTIERTNFYFDQDTVLNVKITHSDLNVQLLNFLKLEIKID